MAKHKNRGFGLASIISKNVGPQPVKPAKRPVVWMDPSDDENASPTYKRSTSIVQKSPHAAKRSKVVQEKSGKLSHLEEQRRSLPIAEGIDEFG